MSSQAQLVLMLERLWREIVDQIQTFRVGDAFHYFQDGWAGTNSDLELNSISHSAFLSSVFLKY